MPKFRLTYLPARDNFVCFYEQFRPWHSQLVFLLITTPISWYVSTFRPILTKGINSKRELAEERLNLCQNVTHFSLMEAINTNKKLHMTQLHVFPCWVKTIILTVEWYCSNMFYDFLIISFYANSRKARQPIKKMCSLSNEAQETVL